MPVVELVDAFKLALEVLSSVFACTILFERGYGLLPLDIHAFQNKNQLCDCYDDKMCNIRQVCLNCLE